MPTLLNDTNTLKVVGEVFGVNKNSTVSSSVDRVKYGMSREKGIRQVKF